MKKIIASVTFLVIFISLISVAQETTVNIIPKPLSIICDSGFFELSLKTKIFISKKVLKNEADLLNKYLLENFGIYLFVYLSKPQGKNFIQIDLNNTGVESDGSSYQLIISKNKIIISAGNSRGIFYGIQSLIQLSHLPTAQFLKIPCLRINDYPRFTWRGMHLDVGRHFFPKDDIKKYIDYLARYKMNVFHWHLTEDQGWRIEIKSHPKLTRIGAWRNGSMMGHYNEQKFDTIRYGGFYTQEDILEIVDYAQKHYITIVPEIEMPGHCLAALAANPQLSCTKGPFEVGKAWGIYEDVYCPKEETFKFLEEVLTEVCNLFPGKYIHIGGDETPKVRWKNCNHCQLLIDSLNLKDEHGLQSYFIKRIENFFNQKGKQIIGWDEILEGGLAQNAAVMSWRGNEGGVAAAKQKHFAVMSPGSHCYFDYYQSANSGEPLAIGGYIPLEKVYSYEPVPKELNDDEKKYILGAQANVWTEYMSTFSQVEYMIFPRLCALAEVAWSKNETKNFEDFLQRLKSHFIYFEKNHINYSKAIFDIKMLVSPVEDNNGLKISFTTYLADGAEIRYSIDEAEINPDLPLIDSEISIFNSTVIKAALVENGQLKGKGFEQTIKFNKATGKKISLVTEPSENYNHGGSFTLVNGITGDLPWRGSDWLGFSGKSLDAIIDFGKDESFSKITMDVLEDTVSWIYLPKSFEIFSSDDGINFKRLKKISSKEIKQMKRQLTLEVETTKSRFIKITAENFGIIPDGFPGASNPAWLFVDEIMVE